MARETIELTDNKGMIRRGKKLYKAHHYVEGVRIVYEEIDPGEYDTRVHALAVRLSSIPDVDLLGVLKDALYDLSLKRLEIIEKALNKELQKDEPSVRTTTRDRGTCVNLAIGGKFAFKIRE